MPLGAVLGQPVHARIYIPLAPIMVMPVVRHVN